MAQRISAGGTKFRHIQQRMQPFCSFKRTWKTSEFCTRTFSCTAPLAKPPISRTKQESLETKRREQQKRLDEAARQLTAHDERAISNLIQQLPPVFKGHQAGKEKLSTACETKRNRILAEMDYLHTRTQFMATFGRLARSDISRLTPLNMTNCILTQEIKKTEEAYDACKKVLLASLRSVLPTVLAPWYVCKRAVAVSFGRINESFL